MQYSEFIDRVQVEAGLDSREEAATLTHAVLETLGERLDRTVRGDIGAQLPNELKDMLHARGVQTDLYQRQEFYNRVGARAGLNYREAAERSWQVLSVLREALTDGAMQNLLADLPDEFRELFGLDRPNKQAPRP